MIGGSWGWILGGIGAISSAHWLAQCLLAWTRRRSDYMLAEFSIDPPAAGWPTLSVALAARDEAEHIEAAVRSLLAQDYPGLEIVVVDDRSTDGTGEILDRIAADDPRLKVVRVLELPPGWLGKNHALNAALDKIQSDWTLFTDADVVFREGVLKKAVSAAVRHGFDHMTAAPEIPSQTVGERLFLAAFMSAFMIVGNPRFLENRRVPVAVGIGAFNLVRTKFLKDLGGFERIRLSVDDDLQLGAMIKRNGGKARLLSGQSAISVRWHVGLWGMIRGLEKNFFAHQEFRLWQPIAGVLGVYIAMAAPHVGAFVDNPLRWINFAGIAGIAALLAKIGPASGVHWTYGFVLPMGGIVIIVAMWRSAWLTLYRGGVLWRSHFYPMRELKEHIHDRNRWLAECWARTRAEAPTLPDSAFKRNS